MSQRQSLISQGDSSTVSQRDSVTYNPRDSFLRDSTLMTWTFQRRVTLHVTFLKVGEINTLKEVFDADVLLRSKWREPELDKSNNPKSIEEIDFDALWNPSIYIDNVIGDPKRTSSVSVEYNDEGEAHIVERRRVKGTFMETMELWEFPFDVQDLSVTIVSDRPTSEVVLEEDDEIHKIYKQSFIDEQEWHLYKYLESEKKEQQKDKADPYAMRYALTVRSRVARRPAYFITNIFSVTKSQTRILNSEIGSLITYLTIQNHFISFLICCLSFVTFAVEPHLVQNRLQLAFTLVLTSVAFKFVALQSLPKVSYLTYLDRYILATGLILIAVCVWHGVQVVIPIQQHPNKDYIALAIIIGIYAIYNLQFIFRILLLPYRKRRLMDKKEVIYMRTVQEEAKRKHAVLHDTSVTVDAKAAEDKTSKV